MNSTVDVRPYDNVIGFDKGSAVPQGDFAPTTLPERGSEPTWRIGQGQRKNKRDHIQAPFDERRDTGLLLMGSRVITAITQRSPRGE